jgi:hypothetical protein
MDRLGKLTQIYLSNAEKIGGETIDNKTFKLYLWEILDCKLNNSGLPKTSLAFSGNEEVFKTATKNFGEWASKCNNTLTSDSSSKVKVNETKNPVEYSKVLDHLLNTFVVDKSVKIKQAFSYYSDGIEEMNTLLLLDRRISSYLISRLSDKIKELARQKSCLIDDLNVARNQIVEFKSKCEDLKREGNILKRYNSKLVFNSFVSDLTEVPKKAENSQVRINKICRNFSNCSIKNMWGDFPVDMDSPHRERTHTVEHKDSDFFGAFSPNTSIIDIKDINLANHFEESAEK